MVSCSNSIVIVILIFISIVRRSNAAITIFGMGSSIGKEAALATGNSIEKSTENLAKSFQASVDKTVDGLDRIADKLTSSVDDGVANFAVTIKEVSKELKAISQDVSDSLEHSVDELAAVLRESIAASERITNQLSIALDSALNQLGHQIENAVDSLKDIAKEFSISLQNINAFVTVRIEMDENWRVSIKYICIAVVIVCVALLIITYMCLKCCGSCIVKLAQLRKLNEVEMQKINDDVEHGQNLRFLNNTRELENLNRISPPNEFPQVHNTDPRNISFYHKGNNRNVGLNNCEKNVCNENQQPFLNSD